MMIISDITIANNKKNFNDKALTKIFASYQQGYSGVAYIKGVELKKIDKLMLSRWDNQAEQLKAERPDLFQSGNAIVKKRQYQRKRRNPFFSDVVLNKWGIK